MPFAWSEANRHPSASDHAIVPISALRVATGVIPVTMPINQLVDFDYRERGYHMTHDDRRGQKT